MFIDEAVVVEVCIEFGVFSREVVSGVEERSITEGFAG
jgi:hypothetical protein